MTLVKTPVASSIEDILQRIDPLRVQLANHPLYGSIVTIADLRIFMASHVFAVWDFMSLLKALQRALTCVEIPWVPTPFPGCRRFINQIVLGEESDEYEGRAASHFEIYLEAMDRAGVSTRPIRQWAVAETNADANGFNAAPQCARLFVERTFRVIREGSVAAQAAAFTFGREDVIPHMFRSLVRDLNQELQGDLSQFVWYLERHIAVDGDEHGPLSRRMVAEVCGDDAVLWQQAADSAEEALRARLELWDGILLQIRHGSVLGRD